jgi:alpha-tubulin suppressor-like RCC1 family protein
VNGTVTNQVWVPNLVNAELTTSYPVLAPYVRSNFNTIFMGVCNNATNVTVLTPSNGVAFAKTVTNCSSPVLFGIGYNAQYNLGDYTNTSRNYTSQVNVDVDSDIVELTSGSVHSVVRTSSGKLYSWGSNANGRLGIGNTNIVTVPVQVSLATTVTSVRCTDHCLALLVTNEVVSWGSNSLGQVCSLLHY